MDPYTYSYDHPCLNAEAFKDNTTCDNAAASCTEKPDGMLVNWYRTPRGGGSEERLEASCLYPGETPERPGGGPLEIAVTEQQLRELPIAGSRLGSQPGRHTLKGAETNIYAEPADQTFSITIIGRKVDIKVTPVEYRWNYGDGTSLVTSAPGGPIPESRWGEKTVTSHVFTATGDVSVGLTTVFVGEFSVDGGPFQPVPGTAEVPSQPRALSIWRSEVKLYADDCNVNPEGAGCS